MLSAMKRKSVSIIVASVAIQLCGLPFSVAVDESEASVCHSGLVSTILLQDGKTPEATSPAPQVPAIKPKEPLVLRTESDVIEITSHPSARKKIKEVRIQIYAIARAGKSSETLGLVARVNFRWGKQMSAELRSHFKPAAAIPKPEAFESNQAYHEFAALARRVNSELGNIFQLDRDFDFQYLYYVRPGDSDLIPNKLPMFPVYQKGFVSHIEFLAENFSGEFLGELMRSIHLPESVYRQVFEEDPDLSSRF